MPSQSLHEDPLNPSHPHHVRQHSHQPHQLSHHTQQHQPQVHSRHPLNPNPNSNPNPNPNPNSSHPHSHSHSQSYLPNQGHTPPSSTGGSLTGLPSREPAHLPLHRKLLFPYDPPDRPLPPIILGHGPDIERINERIYHLLALALRAYVLSWYPRLSPRDRTLLPTLTADVLVPILSPILTRIRSEPERLCRLMLLDMPVILGLHLETYWSARAGEAWSTSPPQPPSNPDTGLRMEKGAGPVTGATAASLDATAWSETNDPSLRIAIAYNRRLPLLSITPAPAPTTLPPDTPYRTQPAGGQPALSPQYLTALSDALLRLHLPAEDYAPAVERLMAREVVGRVVLAGLGRRLGEGWFWWQIGLKVLGEPGTRRGNGKVSSPLFEPTRPPTDGSTTSTDEPVSSTTPKVGSEPSGRTLPELFFFLVARAWTILSTLWTLSTTLFAAYSAAPPISPEYRNLADPWLALGREVFGVEGRTGTERRMWRRRLVWGAVEMVVGLFGRFIDRLLPHLIMTHLLNPRTAIRLTYLIERLMFPLDGYPAPSPIEPMPDEVRDLRARMNTRVGEMLPTPFRAVFCPQPRDVRHILDPLDNPGCNAHLVAMLLDAVVGTLEPELVASVSVPDEPPREREGIKVEQKE